MNEENDTAALQARVSELEEEKAALYDLSKMYESQLSASNARLEGAREWVKERIKMAGHARMGEREYTFEEVLGKLDTPQPPRPADGGEETP